MTYNLSYAIEDTLHYFGQHKWIAAMLVVALLLTVLYNVIKRQYDQPTKETR
jgi:succinate dehydrogenase hydrophobic anchor subunit